MKKTTFILFVIICLFCTKENIGYEISGRIKNIPPKTTLYLFDIENFIKVDSCSINNGQFQFVGSVDYPKKYKLYYVSVSNDKVGLQLWVDNSKIELNIDDEHFKDFTVLGSEVQNQVNQLNSSLLKVNENDFNQWCRLQENFVQKHPSYMYSAILLNKLCRPQPLLSSMNFNGVSIKKTKQLYENLDYTVKQSYYGKAVASFLNNYKNYQIGDKVQDIKLANNEGEIVKLSNFRGNYTLLYFWRYGCSGVNQWHSIISKNKLELKQKKINIMGVSFDTNSNIWKEQSEKMSIDWTNLNDSTGKNGYIGTSFGLDTVLAFYLLNEKGVIVSEGQNVLIYINENL